MRKGEKGSPVVYANAVTKTETDSASGDEIERAVRFLKGYTVFNVEQIEGLPAHFYALADPPAQTPVRIVWGMADTIFSTANADYLDRAFGGSRGVRRLDGSKLFWPEERPDVIAEEARALWNAWAPRTVAR